MDERREHTSDAYVLDQTLRFHLSQLGERIKELLVAFTPDLSFLALGKTIRLALSVKSVYVIAVFARLDGRDDELDVMQVHRVEIVRVQPREAALDAPSDGAWAVVEIRLGCAIAAAFCHL